MGLAKRDLERQEEEGKRCCVCDAPCDEEFMTFSRDFYGEGKGAWLCTPCAEKVGEA